MDIFATFPDMYCIFLSCIRVFGEISTLNILINYYCPYLATLLLAKFSHIFTINIWINFYCQHSVIFLLSTFSNFFIVNIWLLFYCQYLTINFFVNIWLNFQLYFHCQYLAANFQPSILGFISTVKNCATFPLSIFGYISTNLRMFLYIFTGQELLEKCNLSSRATCKKTQLRHSITIWNIMLY